MRYRLTQDQVDMLDMNQLTDLWTELNNEMALLAQTEYMLCRRRRELELQQHPELIEDVPVVSHVSKSKHLDIKSILLQAKQAGVDLASMLKNNSLNERY